MYREKFNLGAHTDATYIITLNTIEREQQIAYIIAPVLARNFVYNSKVIWFIGNKTWDTTE